MRTSIELPDSLFQELKVTAIRRGMKLKQLVEQAVQNEMNRQSGPEFRIEGPLVHCKAKKKINLTNAEIEDLLT